MTIDGEWPALPLSQWQATRDTLQLWLQVVGKVRMHNTPLINHWWNVPVYVTGRGLTTSLMHHRSGIAFQIDLDLQQHELQVATVSGRAQTVALESMPMRDFYGRLIDALQSLGVHTHIWPMPVEIDGAIRFDRDDVHREYNPEHANRFWRALVAIHRVFTEFRAQFVGKASPVHLWWGALDLSTARFSGRTAPPHPGRAPNCGPQVMLEGYSHEVFSTGYWPGGQGEGTFYSYIYPSPPQFAAAPVPTGAAWSSDLGEFLLPYDAVRSAHEPRATLLAFLQSTYAAAADTAGWDRAVLERRSNDAPHGPSGS